MTIVRRAAGIVVAVAALSALVAVSRLPMQLFTPEGAALRLSIGARPERIEICRAQTDSELARVAPQMQQRLICDGTTARYRAEVLANDTPLVDRVVRGGGLRHDRQIYVYREAALRPGPTRLVVRLTRLDSATTNAATVEQDATATGSAPPLDRAAREVQERRRRREEAIPPQLQLDTTMTIAPREVVLISYESEARRLELRRAP
jgi:hypothetical protein